MMRRIAVNGPQDYIAVVMRHIWWAIGGVLFVSAITIFVAYLLPNIYVSKTLIQVEPREVSDEFVKNIITGSTESRLHAIQQSVLSRTNLLGVLNEFQAELHDPDRLNVEERVERLRKHIDIDLTIDLYRRDAFVPFLKISYEHTNPQLAQRVTQRLAALFIEYDNRLREEKVFGTTQFLEEELRKVTEKLHQTSSSLRQLKEQFRYELPDQLDANLRTLDRLQEQLKANSETLDRYVSHRLSLERQVLDLTPNPNLTSSVNRDAGEGTASSSRGNNSPLAQYRERERVYNEMTARYTDKHPDVVRLRTELDRLRNAVLPQELAATQNGEEGEATSNRGSALIRQNLANQLSQVKTEIDIRERERKWIQEELGKYSERVNNTPQREQGIASILREEQELTKQYEDLKKNLADARLAGSLETKNKGGQFRVVDPASYPLKPDKPNRILIVLLGFLLSLGFGFALALGVELADQKLWTQTEVEKLLGVTVLAEIPQVSSGQVSRSRNKRLLHASMFVLATSLFIATLYLVYSRPGTRTAVSENLTRILEVVGSK